MVKQQGIYKITNLATEKFYIGSSCNLHARKNGHYRDLKKNKHCNSYLQNTFNKYGLRNFYWEVIEYCDTPLLIQREQYYLDTLNPKYNIFKKAGPINYNTPKKQKSLDKRLCSYISNIDNNSNCKLRSTQVLEIISLFNKGALCKELSLIYNINIDSIQNILRGRNWKQYYPLVDVELYKQENRAYRNFNIYVLDKNKKLLEICNSQKIIRNKYNVSPGSLNYALKLKSLVKKQFYFLKEEQYHEMCKH